MYNIVRSTNRWGSYGKRLKDKYRYVYFGKILGRNVAIVSNRKLIFSDENYLNIVRFRELPQYLVGVRMKTRRVVVRKYYDMCRFELESDYREDAIYEIYNLYEEVYKC